MTWLVVAVGIAAIAWINWYFFLAERSSASATVRDDGKQEVTIAISGGYTPSVVRVRAGQPVRLVFDRQEDASCSEEVVIGAFGIRRYLPAYERTAVDVPGAAAGTYDFTCGMGMLHGKLVVE